MKPIAFFFTQFVDYGKLIKEQSETILTPPGTYVGKSKCKK
jgi:hypothetical protein